MKSIKYVIFMILIWVFSIVNVQGLTCKYWLDIGPSATPYGNQYIFYKFIYENGNYSRYTQRNAFLPGNRTEVGTVGKFNEASIKNPIAIDTLDSNERNIITNVNAYIKNGPDYYVSTGNYVLNDQTVEEESQNILKEVINSGGSCPGMGIDNSTDQIKIYFTKDNAEGSTGGNEEKPASSCSYQNIKIDNDRTGNISFNVNEDGTYSITIDYLHSLSETVSHYHKKTTPASKLSDSEITFYEKSENDDDFAKGEDITFNVSSFEKEIFFPTDGNCPDKIYINKCTSYYQISNNRGDCLDSDILESQKVKIGGVKIFGIDLGISKSCESYLGNPTYDESKETQSPAYYLQFIFDIMKYAAILLLFVLTIVEFVKATTSNDQNAIKKAFQNTIKRVIIAVIIFILPELIKFLLTVLGAYSPGTCGIG